MMNCNLLFSLSSFSLALYNCFSFNLHYLYFSRCSSIILSIFSLSLSFSRSNYLRYSFHLFSMSWMTAVYYFLVFIIYSCRLFTVEFRTSFLTLSLDSCWLRKPTFVWYSVVMISFSDYIWSSDLCKFFISLSCNLDVSFILSCKCSILVSLSLSLSLN